MRFSTFHVPTRHKTWFFKNLKMLIAIGCHKIAKYYSIVTVLVRKLSNSPISGYKIANNVLIVIFLTKNYLNNMIQ